MGRARVYTYTALCGENGEFGLRVEGPVVLFVTPI